MLELWELVALVTFGSVTLFGVPAVLILYWMSNKTRVLFIMSKKLAKLKRVDVVDGKITIRNKDGTKKTWFTHDVRPMALKTYFGIQPFYVVRWDKPIPIALKLDDEESEQENLELNPDVLTPLLEGVAIRKFMEHKTKNPLVLGGIILVAVIVILGLVLYATGAFQTAPPQPAFLMW